MLKIIKKMALCFGVALGISSVPAWGAVIVEAAAGGTPGTAQAIPGAAFTTPVPPTVFDPPGYPTATVLGTGGGSDVDFFSFSVSAPGLAYFDIDNTPFTFDTIVALFDSAGTLLGVDDDSFPADPGTAFGFDSFLGVIGLPTAGTFYLAVSEFANFPSAVFTCAATALSRPDGAFGGVSCAGATPGDSSYFLNGPEGTTPYTLHLSVQNAATVPEPATIALLCLGLLGFAASRRNEMKRK